MNASRSPARPRAVEPALVPAWVDEIERAVPAYRVREAERCRVRRAVRELAVLLDTLPGRRLQERWQVFEAELWPRWLAGHDRPNPHRWSWGAAALVTHRVVRPSWGFVRGVRVSQWVGRLPVAEPLALMAAELETAAAGINWSNPLMRQGAVTLGLRIALAEGRASLDEITEEDLRRVPTGHHRGMDTLDALLCARGIFARTPQRGASRRCRVARLTPAELVARAQLPEPFRAVTRIYLEQYAARVSDVYVTLRHKMIALGHFWRYLAECHPEVRSAAEVRRPHAHGFVAYAIERAQTVRRTPHETQRASAEAWAGQVRSFFADLCSWATEPGSPLAEHAPPALPFTRHDLIHAGFAQARRRARARREETLLDLERETPRIRAYALVRWQEAQAAAARAPGRRPQAAERSAFWSWALLELLVQSGLRIEEAVELTALDVLRRHLPDGRVYYLLHVKPSKYDRARVIPIGDGLGRVIAEIVRHVRAFHKSAAVPACDHWDLHEKRPRPRAPYLLQAAGHPSALSVSTIRDRLRQLSLAAGARRADGSPLVLLPHDCRRLFASEHLNNDVPVHVIQALLGHATLDTVMVYARLYPHQLVEEYRRAVRGSYQAVHGPEALRAPTAEEWASFARQADLRDMGTHLCALPTGEHCPKGLVCLGCVHAQPKRSAVPVFRRMLQSHRRSLCAARERGEPAGQLAARELEVARIEGALRRAQELSQDVAQAIEAAGSG